MKKNVWFVMMMALVLVVAVSLVRGTADEDYKVIKNAVKTQKSSGEVTVFRLEVTDLKTKKVEVKLSIPIGLIDMIADCVGDEIGEKTAKCKKGNIDVQKMLKVLKSSGPNTLLEVEDEDSLVKIWFE